MLPQRVLPAFALVMACALATCGHGTAQAQVPTPTDARPQPRPCPYPQSLLRSPIPLATEPARGYPLMAVHRGPAGSAHDRWWIP